MLHGTARRRRAAAAIALGFGVGLTSASVMAEDAGCYLRIRTQVMLDGPCQADLDRDGGFSFEMADPKGALVHVSIFADDATGLLSVVAGRENSYQSLSGLGREGRCWAADGRLRACAWPASERHPER